MRISLGLSFSGVFGVDTFAPNYNTRQNMISTIIKCQPGEEEFIKAYGIWEDFLALSSDGIGRTLSGRSGRRIICVNIMQGAKDEKVRVKVGNCLQDGPQ